MSSRPDRLAKCKAPDKAYDRLVTETSKEAGIYGVVKSHFSPNSRKSVWADPQIQSIHPIFPWRRGGLLVAGGTSYGRS